MASSAGASVENWSDSEIRTKLAELGTPVGPVTETTRKILVKKLKRLLQLQGNASSPAKPRRSLARYSSGEDSQGEEPTMPPPTKVRNLRRRTTGPTELSSLADSSDSLRQAVDRTPRGRRSMAVTSSSKRVESIDTDSDSDIPEVVYEDKSKRIQRSDDSVQNRSNITEQSTSRQAVMNSFNRSRKTEVYSSADKLPDYRKSLKVEEEEEDEEETEDDNEDEDKPLAFQSEFLSRLRASGRMSGSYRSSSSPKPERVNYTSPLNKTLDARPYETSYQSFVTKRDTVNSYDQKKTDFDYRDRLSSNTLSRNWQSASTSSFYPKAKLDEAFFFSKYKSNNKLYLLFGILFIVLIVCALYFIFGNYNVGLVLDADGNNYPLCEKDGFTGKCMERKYLKEVLEIKKLLFPKVLEIATLKQCDPTSTGHLSEITMSAEEAVKYLSTKVIENPSNLEKNLEHLKLLILSNPHWEVEVVSENDSDINAILFNGGFAAKHVDLPIGCYLRLMAYTFIKYVVLAALLIGFGYGILFGTRWYKTQKEQHKQEIYSMVNKILTMLSSNYEKNISSYLSINNCRDELIPPIQRSAMKKVWDDAVEFIERHESRVRTEVHSVRGENVKVWVWIPTGGAPLSPNTSIGSASGPILGRLL